MAASRSASLNFTVVDYQLQGDFVTPARDRLQAVVVIVEKETL